MLVAKSSQGADSRHRPNPASVGSVLEQHGYDTSDTNFTIAGGLYPPNAAWGLDLERVGGDVVLQWKQPATDLQHGPASHYRILRASSPQGPWSEIATPTVETLTEALGSGNPGEVFFYKIVATNAAGDAAP